jgi:squalene synthase HpnC
MGWDFSKELERFGPDANIPPMTLAEARGYCRWVTRTHYENFTVASWLLPKRLRPHFHAVYAYCRWADDLADETGGGEVSLGLLEWWRGELLKTPPPGPLPETERGRKTNPPRFGEGGSRSEPGGVFESSKHPVMIALAETIREFRIPLDPFLNLLAAFEQDQRIKEYEAFDQLLGYCVNSANPVGRIVLHLFGVLPTPSPPTPLPPGERGVEELSDEICTGLQLANFWQDVARDYAIGRIYLPREDRERFGVDDLTLFTPAFPELLKFQVERTHSFFERGKPLLNLVPRDCRIDLELFIRGGEAILRAIERQNYDVLTSRPRLGKWTKFRLLLRALRALV